MNRRTFLTLTSAAAAAVPSALGQSPFGTAAKSKLDAGTRAKVAAGVTQGLAFLKKQQRPDGSWSTADHPAMAALAVMAFLRSPGQNRQAEPVRKGLEFVRKNARPDGGIYGKGMGNYNTSICLTALLLAGDSKDAKIIEAAHRYLVGGQIKNSANPANDGGFSYEATGDKPRKGDLDNTVFSLEALALYKQSLKGKEVPKAQDLDWAAAMAFLERCQRQPESGDDAGGFVYGPDDAKSGKAYGSMSYAGLLSFIYADMKKDDARVKAALDWLSKHYSLEENPGQGGQGLYYYYHVMAKGLSIAQVDELNVDGKKIDWRAGLATKLLSLQKPDGSWANDNGRWMEKDPNLVTSYSLLALAFLS
jgi:squalene-hopene/tetraprenyl-beta-curcumene cyclase